MFGIEESQHDLTIYCTVKLVEFESFHQISRRSSFVHVGSDVQLLFF